MFAIAHLAIIPTLTCGVERGASHRIAKTHMVWDSSGADFEFEDVFPHKLKRHEPIFFYRCCDRPMQPPTGCY